MKLVVMQPHEVDIAMEIINSAKAHLKAQGIDQWQSGYPSHELLVSDAEIGKGYFVEENGEKLAYLFIDYDGEPAYNELKGEWVCDEPYVVVHRMAMSENARGKKLADKIFTLVEEMSRERGVTYFRVDTDEDNKKMQHVLGKCGFTYRGDIWFDNSNKIAFDKKF